jgi:hypothetical protein
MTRQYAPDQHRSAYVSSRSARISASASVVAFDRDAAASGSSEGALANVAEQIGTALTDPSVGEFSPYRTKDYVVAWRAVDTEETLVRPIAERRTFLF